MRSLGVLLALMAVCAAGPVGAYLGFNVDRQETSDHHGRDSIHFLIGGDSVLHRASVETTTVVSETTRLGLPAWILRRSTNLAAVTWDTLWEQGESLLMARQAILDTAFEGPAYKVPFAVGSVWRAGLEGTFHFDVNGDSALDTLSIWADTCRVTGRDAITVPYGTVPDCWRIERTMRQALALVQDSLPVRESSFIRSVEWYKDSLWSIKDTLIITARAYTKIIIWLPVADLFSNSVGVLTGLRSGVAEQASTARSLRPSATIVRGNLHLRSADSNAPSRFEVLDVSGRVAARVRDVWRTAGAAPGLYFIRTTTGREASTRPVILVR